MFRIPKTEAGWDAAYFNGMEHIFTFATYRDLARYRRISTQMKKAIENGIRATHIELDEFTYAHLNGTSWLRQHLNRSLSRLRSLKVWAASDGQLNDLALDIFGEELPELRELILAIDLSSYSRRRLSNDNFTLNVPEIRELDLVDCIFPGTNVIVEAKGIYSLAIRAENVGKIQSPTVQEKYRLHTDLITKFGRSVVLISEDCKGGIAITHDVIPGEDNPMTASDRVALGGEFAEHSLDLEFYRSIYLLPDECEGSRAQNIATLNALLMFQQEMPESVARMCQRHPPLMPVDLTGGSGCKWRALRDIMEAPPWLDLVPMPYRRDRAQKALYHWTPEESIPRSGPLGYDYPDFRDPTQKSDETVYLEVYWHSERHAETMFQLMSHNDPIHPGCVVSVVVDHYEDWILRVDWKAFCEQHHVRTVFFRRVVPNLEQCYALFKLFYQLHVNFPGIGIPGVGAVGIPIVTAPWTGWLTALYTGKYSKGSLDNIMRCAPAYWHRVLWKLRSKQDPRFWYYLDKAIVNQARVFQLTSFRLSSLSRQQLEVFDKFYRELEALLPARGVCRKMPVPIHEFTCPANEPWYLKDFLKGNFTPLRDWGMYKYIIPIPMSKIEAEPSADKGGAFWKDYVGSRPRRLPVVKHIKNVASLFSSSKINETEKGINSEMTSDEEDNDQYAFWHQRSLDLLWRREGWKESVAL